MSAGGLVIRRTGTYDDPLFNYAQFWNGRDYEHQAEVAALGRPVGRPGLAFIRLRLRDNYVG